jgi:hypothetical protein
MGRIAKEVAPAGLYVINDYTCRPSTAKNPGHLCHAALRIPNMVQAPVGKDRIKLA